MGMSEREMYVVLELKLQLKNGEEIKYFRDARPSYMGHFSISERELQEIKTIAGLIEVLEKGELLHLDDGDWIDIDDFCKFLIEKNGKDFIPNENEEWYAYTDHRVEGVGMTGKDLVKFWNAYQENQTKKQAFIKKLKDIKQGEADQLVMKKIYDSFGEPMDDFYENKIYTVKIR